jgi:hypothetical protein
MRKRWKNVAANRRIVHLRGKISVEIEDRLVRFDVQEDERPEITLQHLFRRLGVTQEAWQIVNRRGEIVTGADRLVPGKRCFAVPKGDAMQPTASPLAIRVHFKIREQSIPVLPMEPFENVLLAIELALNVPGEWRLFDRYGTEVLNKAQLINRQDYWVRQKEMKVMKNLVRTDDRTVYLKRVQDELDLVQTERSRLTVKLMIYECSVRTRKWKLNLRNGDNEDEQV